MSWFCFAPFHMRVAWGAHGVGLEDIQEGDLLRSEVVSNGECGQIVPAVVESLVAAMCTLFAPKFLSYLS